MVASASFWRGKPFDCLAAWARGHGQAFVSPQLLAEYGDTIEELAARYPGKPRVAWVESLTASAELVFPTERARGATPDPGDEMLLERGLTQIEPDLSPQLNSLPLIRAHPRHPRSPHLALLTADNTDLRG